MKKNTNLLFAIVCVNFGLVACTEDSSNTQNISGRIIDGSGDAIVKAEVCVDRNSNNSCDNDEPTVLTDEKGSYNLGLFTNYDILVQGTDNTYSKNIIKKYRPNLFLKSNNALNNDKKEVNITPFTTYLTSMTQSKSIAKSVEELQATLGITEVNILEDFTSFPRVNDIAQVLTAGIAQANYDYRDKTKIIYFNNSEVHQLFSISLQNALISTKDTMAKNDLNDEDLTIDDLIDSVQSSINTLPEDKETLKDLANNRVVYHEDMSVKDPNSNIAQPSKPKQTSPVNNIGSTPNNSSVSGNSNNNSSSNNSNSVGTIINVTPVVVASPPSKPDNSIFLTE